MITDVYYLIEWNRSDDDDWYSTGGQFDSLESAQRALHDRYLCAPEFKLRIVKRTVIEEVVS